MTLEDFSQKMNVSRIGPLACFSTKFREAVYIMVRLTNFDMLLKKLLQKSTR